jgi:predicted O-methyltransferase YrrM
MINITYHYKIIINFFYLRFKLIFFTKYILGLFEEKIIQLVYKNKIKEFKELQSKGLYSFDWATGNIHNFLTIQKIKKLGADIQKFKILEIGSFEGYSANIFNKIFPGHEIYCVDPWFSYSELANIDFNKIEKNFDSNTKNLNIKKFKILSNDFFKINEEFFDIIYIDGAHDYQSVLSDANNSIKILRKNGIIFFDDFLSEEGNKREVMNAIKVFLESNSSLNLKLIFINSQIGFRLN